MDKVKLLIVDDHPLFVQGMKTFLESNGYEVVATAKSGAEALLKYEMTEPDLVLMDLQMSYCNGLETMELLLKDYPMAKVVFLSACEDELSIVKALEGGANGFLLKGMEPNDFLKELDNCNKGKISLAKEINLFAIKNLKNKEELTRINLTERQIEILRYIVQGETYKEIAKSLNLKEVTVKYHINEVISKFCLNNRSELIAYVIKNNII